jgi:hypothetical protein
MFLVIAVGEEWLKSREKASESVLLEQMTSAFPFYSEVL